MTPRRRPSQERSRLTAEAIVEAAAQVFDRHGYEAGTTNRVAERAGVSIGTVYQYFADKDDLLRAVARRHLAEASEALAPLSASLDGDAAPAELVANALRVSLDLHQGRPGLHRLLLEEGRLPAEVRVEAEALLAGLAGELATWLRRVRPDTPDPMMTAMLTITAIEAWAHGYAVHPADWDREAMVATASRLLALGVD